MNGLALDSGEFISADELNAKWLPRKATEEEMIEKQPDPLRLADALQAEFPGYEVADVSAAELRRLAAVEQELEALKRAISDAEPVAWMVMNGVCNYQLCGSKKSADHLRDELQKRHDLSGSLAAMSVEPLYTLKGIK